MQDNPSPVAHPLPHLPHLLKADHISLSRQGKPILQNISLDITKGDFISLIGPNGAGKTTLLKILLGIEKPDNGNITWQPDLKIGYMPQRLAVDGLLPITVERFLNLGYRGRAIDHLPPPIADSLSPIASKQLNSLSGGELQRVLLARALLGNPDILMLDEPVQNLDVHGQLHFYELLEKLYQAQGLTIVMVSHDLHMVMRATRKVICLFGHICCEGAPEAVSQHPRFIELFGHDMSKMLKVYQHQHDHGHISGIGQTQSCSNNLDNI